MVFRGLGGEAEGSEGACVFGESGHEGHEGAEAGGWS